MTVSIADIVVPNRPLPDGWSRVQYRGDRLPHIQRRWGIPDPTQPHYTQRRCDAEVMIRDDGQIGWRLTTEDGPVSYFAFASGACEDVDSAIDAAETAAAQWMSDPVAYPKLLRCPQTGRPCAEGPCSPRPWSGCAGVTP